MLASAKPPFEPYRKASLKILTFKTFFLFASGRKRGEVRARTFRSLKHKTGWQKVTVSPSSKFLAKNQLTSDSPITVQPVVIPALQPTLDQTLSEDITICSVRTLDIILTRLRTLGENKHILFISFKDDLSKDTEQFLHGCNKLLFWFMKTVMLKLRIYQC